MKDAVAEFEKVFEDMEVKTSEMDQALDKMNNVYETSIDQGEVISLLRELADKNGMYIEGQLGRNMQEDEDFDNLADQDMGMTERNPLSARGGGA